MDLGLAGRSALVVGASTGIGFESARLLAREGVAVTIAARHDDSLAEAAATIAESSDSAVATLQIDATTEQAATVLAGHFGDQPLDILVVAVGGSIRGQVESFDDDQWRANYDLNVLAPVRVVRTLLPNLLSSEHGTVVILGAAASKMPYPNQGVSNVHKAGGSGTGEDAGRRTGTERCARECGLSGSHQDPSVAESRRSDGEGSGNNSGSSHRGIQ